MDVVDNSDKVVGKDTKKNIYLKNLMHRIIHVLIFDKNNNMALQLRSKTCSFCPGHWSTAVGGHVRSSESYETAALREFKEELGAAAELNFFSKDFYKVKNTPDKFLTTFKCIFEGPFYVNKKEVEKIEFFSIEKIKQMINKGEKFHPELLFLLKNHFLVQD